MVPVAPLRPQVLRRSPFVVRRCRSAMTLIELLIVIVILATLTAAALPILTPTTSGRRLRETSRSLNTYLTQQQSQAISTRRPVGVALKRLSSETGRAADRGVCLEVVPVEVPVPYAGFDENSRMRVALNPNVPGQVVLDFITRGNTHQPNSDNLPLGWDADLVAPILLRLGDVVEVLGNQYRIVDSGTMAISNSYLEGHLGASSSATPAQIGAVPINNTGQLIEPVYDAAGQRLSTASIRTGNSASPFWSEPCPYKIHRQPVTTSSDPFQLPEGTAIDLEASGIVGEVPFHYEDGDNTAELMENVSDGPVFIMFSPEGNVERVQYRRVQYNQDGNLVSSTLLGIPATNISLLVGSRELIPADTTLDLVGGTETERETEKAKLNWLNLESRWVTIGSQNGNIVTTENAFVNVATLPPVDFDQDGSMSPLDIRRTQIQAAQEFAREMRRTTGG